jgi:uncharacterized protein
VHHRSSFGYEVIYVVSRVSLAAFITVHMIQEIILRLSPAEAEQPELLRQRVMAKVSAKSGATVRYQIQKKSIDARKQTAVIQLTIKAYINEDPPIESANIFRPQNVTQGDPVHIIGAGPAGLFCAMRCIELGYKPIIFERGKQVRERRRDLALLNKEGILNEESNYCFGEGGAGTYSDGKLYTRSNKRGNVAQVLEWFHQFGADERILFEAHPHIGTNKLPQIIEAMREAILDCGGEIYFNAKLTGIAHDAKQIQHITINGQDKVAVRKLVLATGHSAHDVYALLHEQGIYIEAKPFALGVRIEHPQQLIDQIQYHCDARDPFLPPASYSLVHQVADRGVFSFCMCPGGIIAPASTRQGTVVVNGWSPSKRNNPYANSGMVVSVGAADFGTDSPLAALNYQYTVEQKAFQAGGGNFVAPAQRLTDFATKKASGSLPACSYIPGVAAADLSEVLPAVVFDSIAAALWAFGKKMHGYYTSEAIVVATESRTSSPVRIPRDADTLAHLHIQNLYPCAEGAGYAGGIVSAAMDGIKVAEMLAGVKADKPHSKSH